MADHQRMAGLDGVRALAVMAVVWHHAHPAIPGLPMTGNGFLGVDMFFVLSGFLITTLLLREQADTGRISLRDFYIRRSLRIFPLYYAVLLVLAAYYALAGKASAQAASYFADLPYVATYTSNWVDAHSVMAVSWSLSAEEQFYLVWPPLLAWLGARGCVPLLVGFLLLNQGVNFGLFDAWLPYAQLPMLQATFTPIVLGVLLAFCLAAPASRRALQRLAQGPAPWLAAAAILLVMNVPGDVRGWPRLAFHLLGAYLLGCLVLRPDHALVRVLEVRWLVVVGMVSYGMYLLHMPVLSVVDRLLPQAQSFGAARFALTALGTFAAAWVSFRWFETPFLRLKSAFSARRAPAARPGASPAA